MARRSTSGYEVNRYRTILEMRIAELKKVISRRDGIVVEQISDQVEEIQRASEQALEICRLDRESIQLRNARAALLRIRQGTFGVCEQCEEEIHPKRLAAIPWAALCVICQEAADREGQEIWRRHSAAEWAE
jgi:DnaK suppressor protein